MAELKLPRLLAAAKEFNIGQDTLVEFLVSKGFGRDDLKPTAKLTEDMYRSLQQEFQSDKVAKTKADQIEIPKGATTERRKRDEEEISFKNNRNRLLKLHHHLNRLVKKWRENPHRLKLRHNLPNLNL